MDIIVQQNMFDKGGSIEDHGEDNYKMWRTEVKIKNWTSILFSVVCLLAMTYKRSS